MKKFEITKEQLKSLIEAAVCNIKDYVMNNDGFIDDWMKDEFPDAFKKELEVGKWYKNRNGKTLFLYNGENYRKGFDAKEVWSSNIGTAYDYNIIEATPQEVESALICEAKKRGFIDRIQFKELEDSENGSLFNLPARVGGLFCFEDNKLYTTGRGKWCVFNNGKWATIIETITIQEAEKLLNKKII